MGQPAGSLEIMVLMNLARLQNDVEQMKRTVGSGVSGVEQSFDRARASSERYLEALRRETAALGQSPANIKNLEIEANAAAAAARGYDQLANEIREAGAALQQAKALAAAAAAEKERLAIEAREAAAAEQQYGAALAALRASVDPVGAAQAKLNQQLELAAQAYKRGDLSAQEYANATSVLEGRLEQLTIEQARSGQQVVASAGQQRQGMQQLSMQLNDVATMWALGARPQQIFASQAGQVIQALQLMTGGTSKLAGFLAGPWGVAITTATIVLSPFIAKLFDTADAADAATSALQRLIDKRRQETKEAMILQDAQSDLNKLYKRQAELQDFISRQRKDANGQAMFSYSQQRELAEVNQKIAEGLASARDEEGRQHRERTQRLGQQIAEQAKLQAATSATERAQAQYSMRVREANDAFDKSARSAADQQKLLTSLTAAERDLKQAQAAARSARGNKAEQTRLETLARENTATNELIDGLYKVAAAYMISDAAAIRAEATAKATEQGIKKRADLEAYVAQQLRKTAAERIVDTARSASDLLNQAENQELVNQSVRDGVLAVEDMTDAMTALNALRGAKATLKLAEDIGDVKAIEAAKAAIADLEAAQLRSNEAARTGASLAAQRAQIQSNDQEIEMLRLEGTLLGASNRERAVALAQLKAEQELRSMRGLSPEEQAAYVKSAKDRANAQEDFNQKTAEHNILLGQQLDLMEQLDERAQSVADNLSNAFGTFGDVVGTALTTVTDRMREQAEMEKELAQLRERIGDGWADNLEYVNRQQQLSARFQTSEIGRTGQLFSASKRLFNEKSSAYKAFTIAEKVLAALQLANTIKSMAMDATKTASSVANSTARGAADQAAGAAKMFSILGPFAFPVVAAMIALLVSLGLKGGGGSASMPSIPSAEDVQDAIGTGTVLGDNKAQSQSLANALTIMAENSNEDLEYSNDMVRHLRSIDDGIGALTASLARQLNLSGGAFDTSSFKLGSKSSGVQGLFGSTTTRALYDQGIQVAFQTVGEFIADGVEAQVYNVIETTKKNSGLLGIGGSTKTSYETLLGQVPGEIERQMQLVVADLGASVVAYGKQLGLDVADIVNARALPAARLSFKDMNGEEIEAALRAYFSSVADEIALGLNGIIDLTGLQKAGEGVYETLARITHTLMTIDTSLKSIGMDSMMSFSGDWANTAAKNAAALAAKFGGLGELQDAVAAFADDFLTEAEKMDPVIAAVRAEMDRLGYASVTTNDQFKDLVRGLDLGTLAGQDMFAALMSVAPAFAKVNDFLAETAVEADKAAEALTKQVDAQARAAIVARVAEAKAAADAQAAKIKAFDDGKKDFDELTTSLLKAGDSAAYVGEQMERAFEGNALGLGSGNATVDALMRQLQATPYGDTGRQTLLLEKIQATLNHQARAQLSAQALTVKNIDRALAAVPNLAADMTTALGHSFQTAIEGGFRNLTGQQLYSGLSEVMAKQAGRAAYGDQGVAGIAGLLATREQLMFAATNAYSAGFYNRIVGALGPAVEGLLPLMNGGGQMIGEDVKALTEALDLLGGQLETGKISAEEARRYVEGLVKQFPDLANAAQSLEAQATRAAGAAMQLANSGLRSIEFYFGSLSDIVAKLAENGSQASEELNTLEGVVGRLRSVAIVFGESVAAVQDGIEAAAGYGFASGLSESEMRNVAAATAISNAARAAAGFLMTQQAAGIAEALEQEAAFANVSPQLRKTAALLLEGIGAYDAPAFEAAFLRMSDALAKGTIDVAQFNTLFNYSRDVFEDTATKFGAMRDSVIDDLRSIIQILDEGIGRLAGGSSALTQLRDERALAYLRGIKGVPDLNDMFRDAVNTISSLTTDPFSFRDDYRRELGQRSALLGGLRENTIGALTQAEQMVGYMGQTVDELKTTNQKLDELNAKVEALTRVNAGQAAKIARMADIAEDQDINGVPPVRGDG